MIVHKMIIIEAYCDSCGKGQLQNLLQSGFDLGVSSTHVVKVKCDCGHENEIEDTISVIPNEFFVFSKTKGKVKKDDSIKKFLED